MHGNQYPKRIHFMNRSSARSQRKKNCIPPHKYKAKHIFITYYGKGREKGSILGQYFICLRGFFWPNQYKNLSSCSWEITKISFCRKWLEKFHISTLWIWQFGIFDKHPQGCDEVKNSMGLLQGPKLMAWTTKSLILENHWVPWGCMAHLGSVKSWMSNILTSRS